MINEEKTLKNKFVFPQVGDITTVVVLNREDIDDKFFLIFDVRKNGFIRRIKKTSMQDEAFAIDHLGKLLAYPDGDTLHIKQVRLPNCNELINVLKPRFK